MTKPFAVHQEVDFASAKAWFGDHIRRHPRRVDLPALLQDGAIAILMTSTKLESSRSVERRVRKDLAQIDPRTGIACFPADGESVDDIMAAAADAAARDLAAMGQAEETTTETKAEVA